MLINEVEQTTPQGLTDYVGTATISNDAYLKFKTDFSGNAILSLWVKCTSLANVTFNEVAKAVNTTWQKLIWEFTAQQGAECKVKFEPGTFYIYEAMLEQGTKPSDWTISPDEIAENQTDILEKYAELVVTTDGITARVGVIADEVVQVGSQVTQLADSINLKVSKNDVINQINISTEDILISGAKVNIEGQVTFQSFNSNLQNGWNNMQDQVGEANDTLDEITMDDRTTINGGKIATNTIEAEAIKVADLFAQNINMTGTFIGTAQAWLPPTKADLARLKEILNGATATAHELKVYDFNNSGTLTLIDYTYAKKLMWGAITIDDDALEGYRENKMELSTITVTIDPSDPGATVTISGTNSFGSDYLTKVSMSEVEAPKLATKGELITIKDNNLSVLFEDTSASDIKELLRNKLELIPDVNGMYLISGGWQGNAWGHSVGSYIDGVKQLTFFTADATYYCRYENASYTYTKTTMTSF